MRVPSFIESFDIDLERNEIINRFKLLANKPDYEPLVGDDYVTLVDIFLKKTSEYFEKLNAIISQNYLEFSQNAYLDELVGLLGLRRNEAIKPVAKVEIKADTPTFIPKGARLTDGKGHFALLLHDVEIDESLKALASIESQTHTNEQYETTSLEIPNIYITEIKIAEPFKGYKAVESDEELKERFRLALHRFSTAGSRESYLFYILSAESITKAEVYNAGAGNVEIVYLSPLENEIAVEKIKEALENRVPLTDNIIYTPCQIVELELEIELETKQDYQFADALSLANIEVKKLFDSFKIGGTPHESAIIEAAFSSDCKKVVVKTPIPQIEKTQILALKSLSITKAQNA